jgi:pimeloyl-ACP methyl ester carboxylesterase
MAASEKTVLLIHGFLESTAMWNDLVKRSSRKVRYVALPLAGHAGGSSSLPQDIDGYAEVIRDYVQAHALEDVFLVGHSMGGYTSLAYANQFPDKVRGLCMFHSTASADSPEKRADREKAIALVNHNKVSYARTLLTSVFAVKNREAMKEKIDELVGVASGMTEEAIIAAQRAMMNRPERIDFLKTRHFPLFYFLGQYDELLPPARIGRELSEIPGLIIHECSKAGHMGQYESPSEAFGFIERIVRAH